MAIHEAARRGFSKESASYERGRPEYPDGLLGWLRDSLGAKPGAQVVDLGAGTGKFTRLLARTGADVVAVEPVDAMRERLALASPGIRALAGTAESMPLDDRSVDAMGCAQAFHWFANSRALQEIHRVLRPGGKLGLVWNVRDESVDWVAAITAIITPYEGDAPRFYTGRWRQPFEQQELFTPLQCTVFANSHVGTFDQVVIDRTMSVSFIAALSDDEKCALEARLRALHDAFPALREAEISFPYHTEAWLGARLG
ncbi:Methyltransferase type 11 [Bradyrhizobium sp. STM 3843]|uniref:class I SAM-dependent methyltransferase n=1 Tax=Bradyrhizobium sp. STM 3843 TaxID=551947 RepID=UPI0002406BCA|nr:class I SAM-dependent methyltransferase [Bradyrhizobium sp. STM 3843]CCE05878.1 Methyltransferase type 11 [Bradyrhizobium sp. STM 3843]